MIIEIDDATPQAWRDLIEGLAILSKGQANDTSPTYCEHDKLLVCADPAVFSQGEIVKLDELGFFVDSDGCFRSYRFGSA